MVQVKSYADRLRGEKASLIYQVNAKALDRDAWYFIELDKAKKEIFLREYMIEPLDLPRFGKVIYKGWGTEPPADIIDKINEEYK